MDAAPRPDPSGPGSPQPEKADRLAEARAALAELEEQPVAAHVELLGRVNAALAAELASLDEV